LLHFPSFFLVAPRFENLVRLGAAAAPKTQLLACLLLLLLLMMTLLLFRRMASSLVFCMKIKT
jgi:hypothetical protein